MTCGRVRTNPTLGWTPVVTAQMATLQLSILRMEEGHRFEMVTGQREYVFVLIEGSCQVSINGEPALPFGPRRNPFDDRPHALLLAREQTVAFVGAGPAFIAAGSAPAATPYPNAWIRPDQVREEVRGSDNWSRLVRKVCWSDNTQGNLLLAGETCTPPGNWSTMPPHRHQFLSGPDEVPYEEIYLFRFSRPQGFGLVWQFDDAGMDQAFSVRSNDAVYHDAGYHPVAAGPGTRLYHLSLMAGPYRRSNASVHPDYQFLLDEKNLANQFTPQ